MRTISTCLIERTPDHRNGTTYPLTTSGYSYTITTANNSFTVTTEPNADTVTIVTSFTRSQFYRGG